MTFKELRINAGLTQATVGKKMNVDQSCISRWESGTWPPMRKLHKKLAKLYGVTEAEIKALADEIKAANREDA